MGHSSPLTTGIYQPWLMNIYASRDENSTKWLKTSAHMAGRIVLMRNKGSNSLRSPISSFFLATKHLTLYPIRIITFTFDI
jgi:hypothetical protein